MKRKLNQDDVPTLVLADQGRQNPSAFSSLGLDSRLLQAIVKEGFSTPTLVQSKVIPLAIEGKDILGILIASSLHCYRSLTFAARSMTGSGKTAAYLLPILEAILRRKAVNHPSKYHPSDTNKDNRVIKPPKAFQLLF